MSKKNGGKYQWNCFVVGGWRLFDGRSPKYRVAAHLYGKRHGIKFRSQYVKLMDKTVVARIA